MSHRLQVLISEDLDLAITAAVTRDRGSEGEFVREAMEAALAARIAEADPVAALAARDIDDQRWPFTSDPVGVAEPAEGLPRVIGSRAVMLVSVTDCVLS